MNAARSSGRDKGAVVVDHDLHLLADVLDDIRPGTAISSW